MRGGRQADRQAEPRDGRQRPGLLGEVLPLLGRRAAARADGGRPLPPRRRARRSRTATRTRSASWRCSARRSTAATSRSRRSPPRSTSSRPTRASTSRSTSTPPRAGSSRRSSSPTSSGTSGIPRVQSINASGHKYGLVYPGVGWAIWRDEEALPKDLIFDVNYLGGHMPTFALNFSRPGSEVIAQYYMFTVPRPRGLHARCMQSAQDVALHISQRRSRRSGPYRLLSDGKRAAGVRVHAQAGRRELHGVRRLRPAAPARLAGPRLHVPGEPPGPERAADRRPRRDEHRDGRPAARAPARGDRVPGVARARRCRARRPRQRQAFAH